MHESINVNRIRDYTRSWFACKFSSLPLSSARIDLRIGANSVFAQTILDLARRKPHLIFGKGAEPYVIE